MKLLWTACAVLSFGLWLTGCGGGPSAQPESAPPKRPAVQAPAKPENGSTKPPEKQEKPTKPAVC